MSLRTRIKAVERRMAPAGDEFGNMPDHELVARLRSLFAGDARPSWESVLKWLVPMGYLLQGLLADGRGRC